MQRPDGAAGRGLAASRCSNPAAAGARPAAATTIPSLAGQGTPTASQTAWALLGLLAAGEADSDAVRAGIDYLLATQQPDGNWHEEQFTGTGFPKVFYLKYHMYSLYFPLMALARYACAIEPRTAAAVRGTPNARRQAQLTAITFACADLPKEIPMRFPLSLTTTMVGYMASKKLTGEKRFPLVLMLEPLHACNLTCTGCGRIREYSHDHQGKADASRSAWPRSTRPAPPSSASAAASR